MDSHEMFYRKYAFGADGKKLAGQLDWLTAHSGTLPLCEVIRSERSSEYCCCDIATSDSSCMFQYIHPTRCRPGSVFSSLLESVRGELHVLNARPADAEHISRYISAKVTDNLNSIMGSRVLAELLSYDTLTINHKEYLNLPYLASMFEPEHLAAVFAGDTCCDIHGDLTVENIICTGGGFYLSWANPGNIHESSFLDYAKLLRSCTAGTSL